MYVPIVPAQGKELYVAVCSLQAKAKRKRMVRIKAFSSHRSEFGSELEEAYR